MYICTVLPSRTIDICISKAHQRNNPLETKHYFWKIQRCEIQDGSLKPRTPHLNIHEVIPTQRTCALVAALKPPEQTDGMEGVLASRASFVRGLHVGRDDRITDGAFALSLQRALHVLPERQQTIHQVAVREHYHSLDSQHPAPPLFLVYENPTPAGNQSRLQRICWWKVDGHRYRRRFLVDGDAGNQFGRLDGDFD